MVFLLRFAATASIGCILYLVVGYAFARSHSPKVTRDVLRYDIKLAVTSILFTSLLLQLFALAHEKWGISRVYTSLADKGLLWWIISLFAYVLLWDAVSYLGHRLQHHPRLFRLSHFQHHRCRPPVPWSTIAFAPLDTIFVGVLPYVVPLFILPFHMNTVYALNIVLMVWATLVHSSYNWSRSAVFITPKDHNLHHHFGCKNANFGPLFTLWDRIFGTLNRTDHPKWWRVTDWTPEAAAAKEDEDLLSFRVELPRYQKETR